MDSKQLKERFQCQISIMEELSLASAAGFKSKHDDFIDTISMLGSLNSWRPSQEVESSIDDNNSVIWSDDDTEKFSHYDSYIV